MRGHRAPTNRRHCADAVGSGMHTPAGLVFTVEDANSGNRAAVSLSPLGIQNAVTAVAGYLDSTQHADLASAVRARGLYNKHGAALNRVGEIAAESLVFIGENASSEFRGCSFLVLCVSVSSRLSSAVVPRECSVFLSARCGILCCEVWRRACSALPASVRQCVLRATLMWRTFVGVLNALNQPPSVAHA